MDDEKLELCQLLCDKFFLEAIEFKEDDILYRYETGGKLEAL